MARNIGVTDEQIIELYQSGTDNGKMKQITGLTQTGIYWVLKKHNIKRTRSKRTHHFNEEFFDTWSDDMAWVLGLFITDGCLSQYTINFSQKDECILHEISRIMKLDYKLKKNVHSGVSTLSINSKNMSLYLESIGITSNKSLIVPFPKVPSNHMPSFIRGVIDGDGWVHHKGYVANVTTGSLPFANGLYDVFKRFNLKTDITTHSEGKNKIYRVWVRGKESVKKLGLLLYQEGEQSCVIHKKERMQYWSVERHKERIEKENMLRERRKKDKKQAISIKETGFSHWYVSAISKQALAIISQMEKERECTIEELLINGFKNLASVPCITLDKAKHPSDKVRIEFSSTTDVLDKMKVYAKEKNISLIDLLEETVTYIK